MKTVTRLLVSLLFAGHAWAGSEAAPAGEGMAVEQPPAVVLPPGMDTTRAYSYSIGRHLGMRLHGDVRDLDIDTFTQALREVYAGQPSQLDDAQMQFAMEQLTQARQMQAMAAHEKKAAENLAKASEFLAGNGKRKGVKTTASGLQYEVLGKGKGASPAATDVVRANYHGTLADGTVFDSTQGGEPVEFPLDRVIPGWTEGVQLMNKGAKFRFWLPPALAYGARGVDEVIGPNQLLVFEVELVDFHAAPAAPAVQDEPTL